MHYIKYLLSFLKSKWELRDYPIRYFNQHGKNNLKVIEKIGHSSLPKWRVQIINWQLLFGLGETKTEAYLDLEQKFSEHKKNASNLPRPGAKVAMKFEKAPIEKVQLYENIAEHFFIHIIKMNYRDVLITDLSSIWDFPVEDSDEEMSRKIALRYGVDVSELIKKGFLVEIFERINEKGRII
jgi:hypothetical protein